MVAEAMSRPLIWVLKGLRAGDTAQAMELALLLGGRVESKQLSFTALHAVPNFLLGARVTHLTAKTKNLLRPPWPDIVVATGRRTAPAALWIKNQSSGKTKLLQIGRPRMALSDFDCVVTTPQYGLPTTGNVVNLPVPFASPKSVATEHLKTFVDQWQSLPKPWILAVVGGQKFPLQLGTQALAQFGQALHRDATATGGSVVLLDSPRSPAGAIKDVEQHLTAPHWTFKRGESPNPYQAALQLCDVMVVTGDSVSMVTEMLLTGKPTKIFRLAVSPFAVRWSAQSGLGAVLARSGILSPPRNVDGFMQNLIDQGLVADLMAGSRHVLTKQMQSQHAQAIDAIKTILKI